MSERLSKCLRSSVAVLLTVGALAAVPLATAGAQTPAPATPPPTTNLLDDLLRQLLPTTTTPPPPAPPTTKAPAGAASAATAKTAASTGPTPATTTPPGVIPAQYLPIINSVRRTGSKSTAPLVDALRPLQDLGFTASEAAIAGFGHFPVAGDASWSDDWLEARFGPPFHLHQGTDIFAARGTPVRAPFSGIVRYAVEGAGGNVAYLTLADGTFYYMAHMDAFSKKISSGAAVKQGDVLGTTGDTGNASGGATHVHFEVHPRGGGAVNPKPFLDGWLTEAVNGSAAVLGANNAGAPRALTAAGVLRRFEDPPSSSGRAVGTLLWASSVSAGGGTIRIAELQVARMAGRIDWGHQTTMAQAQADAAREGRTLAAAVLGPITPAVLLPILRGGS